MSPLMYRFLLKSNGEVYQRRCVNWLPGSVRRARSSRI